VRASVASSAASTRRHGPSRALFGIACLCALGLAATLGSGAPSAGAVEACPNESLRVEQESTHLPQCRAFEKVSPSEKEDVDILIQQVTQVSASGQRFYFIAPGGFEGANMSSLDTHYLAERGAGSWSTKQIGPPLPVEHQPGVEFYAFSDDLSTGMFGALDPPAIVPGEPANNYDLYLAATTTSTYSLITAQAPAVADIFAGSPTVRWVSPDLTHVLFDPLSETVYFPGDPAGALDYFYYVNALTGEVSAPALIPDESTPDPDDEVPVIAHEVGDPEAGAGAGTSESWNDHAISDDGSRIFFTVGPFMGGSVPIRGAQLYVREDHGTPGAHSLRVSAPQPGAVDESPEALFSSWFRAASSDGSKVFFTSCEALTADATVDTFEESSGNCAVSASSFTAESDLYLYDVETGELTDLTTADPSGADVRGFLGASEDGSRAYFVAQGNLAEGATGSGPKLYLWEQGEGVRFVAGLDPEDQVIWEVDQHDANSETEVTPDGEHLAFSSLAPIEPGFDSAGHSQVYLYDATTDELVCASCVGAGPAGADVKLSNGVDRPASGRIVQRNLVEDGSLVFFETADPLSAEDINGRVDVYGYDAAAGELGLISGGNAAYDSHFSNTSPSGEDVFFKTRQRLLGWDGDELIDIYDARVGGGFPEPDPPAPPCGLQCQGQPSGTPGDPGAASAAFVGPPSPTVRRRPARRCAKGRHKVRAKGKVRCVKANNKRRTSR
jgi:hypothetical protein